MSTDIWRVTHTFDSDHCPLRRFIPGGYGCNPADGAPCTDRNCPALTPGGDTLDLGVPCAKCGGTDGWICECSFTPIDPRRSTQMLRAKITNEPTPPEVLQAIETIAAYLRRGAWRMAIISDGGGASFHLTNVHDLLFGRAVENAKCNCHLHKPGESTGGWQCPVHGAQF